MNRKKILYLVGVLAVIIGALLDINPVHANWFSSLVRNAEKAASTQIRLTKVASKGAKVSITIERDTVIVTALSAAGAAAGTVVLQNSDDVIRALKNISGPIFLPTELVKSKPKLVGKLLRARSEPVGIVDDLGESSLQLAKRAGKDVIVVEAFDGVTMTLNAWSRRALLDQALMRDLAARMKIVVIVDRSDQYQRTALKKQFGKKAVFVDSEESLSNTLQQADKRLVTLLGHVEGDSFVLRNSANRVVIDRKLDDVHSAIDESQSVGLLLGCNVTCNVKGSGPTTVIDALDTAKAFGESSKSTTPAEFLQSLAKRTGPLHIDTDLLGRMRATSIRNVRVSDGVFIGGALTVRAVLSRSPAAPMSAVLIFQEFLFIVLFLIPMMVVFFGAAGWFVILMFGISIRQAWRLSKEHYAKVLSRPEEQIDSLTKTERFLLILAGPCGLIMRRTFLIGLGLVNFAFGIVGLSVHAIIRTVCPTKLLFRPKWSAVGLSFMGKNAEQVVPATVFVAVIFYLVLNLTEIVVLLGSLPLLLLFCILLLIACLITLARFPVFLGVWPTTVAILTFASCLPFLVVSWLANLNLLIWGGIWKWRLNRLSI